MDNQHGEGGPGVADPLEAKFQSHEGETEAGQAEFANESKAFAAAHGLNAGEYAKEVGDLHDEAERATREAAAEQQPQPVPAEVAAAPSVEAARATVQAVASTPEAPSAPASPAQTISPEAPAAPPAAQPEQNQPARLSRNPVVNQLRLLAGDIRGLFYRGRHAAPKNSADQDPAQK